MKIWTLFGKKKFSMKIFGQGGRGSKIQLFCGRFYERPLILPPKIWIVPLLFWILSKFEIKNLTQNITNTNKISDHNLCFSPSFLFKDNIFTELSSHFISSLLPTVCILNLQKLTRKSEIHLQTRYRIKQKINYISRLISPNFRRY